MLFFLVLAFVFVPEKTFHRKTTRFFAELYRKFKNKDQKVNIRKKKGFLPKYFRTLPREYEE